jgi:glycosyltransferase involved in cell wall biosynthesis
MSMAPEISVVMAVHNGADDLSVTLDSVLQQEDADFELVAVDDGSTDSSQELLHQYAAQDARLRVLAQPHGGLTKALVRGCEAAQGRFVARQDVGDNSLPGRLCAQRELLAQDDSLALVSCWTAYVGPCLEPLFESKGRSPGSGPLWILDDGEQWGVKDGPTHHGSVMFRRAVYEAVGGYRKEFYYGQDWDLWYRLAAVGRFQMVPEVLYSAMVKPGAISSVNRSSQNKIGALSRAAMRERRAGRNDADFLKRISNIRPAAGTSSPKRKHAKKSSGYYFIGECLRKNNDSRARIYLRGAIEADWTNWRAWARLIQLTMGPR